MKIRTSLIWALLVVSLPAGATEWLHDVKVVKLGTYQNASGHFVWFSETPPGCIAAVPQNPVMNFDESKTGGKSLMATLMAALLNDRMIDLQADGCQIVEVHLK